MQTSTLLDNQLLSADDVLLQPRLGRLLSRSEAKLKPFIYSAPMDTVTGFNLAKAMLAQNEIPVICRELDDKEYIACIKAFHNTAAFFAVGATEKELKRFILRIQEALPNLPEDTKINIAIDIAHGDSIAAYIAIGFLRTYNFVHNIMSGSICTGTAALRSMEAGCTHLRIGVGPGSVCTTRMMTGVGVPQLSAVYMIHKALLTEEKRKSITLIADGGIKYPGDAVKYIAAGADAIMMGSVFSKTLESPGWKAQLPVLDPQQVLSFPRPEPIPEYTKQYRGHASADFQQDHRGTVSNCPEGMSTAKFKYDGVSTVETICNKFRGGMASAISYLGLTSLDEVNPENCTFMKITTSTFLESMPHNKDINDVKSI